MKDSIYIYIQIVGSQEFALGNDWGLPYMDIQGTCPKNHPFVRLLGGYAPFGYQGFSVWGRVPLLK